jgi:ABC-type multidrug transport system ATPase subunit
MIHRIRESTLRVIESDFADSPTIHYFNSSSEFDGYAYQNSSLPLGFALEWNPPNLTYYFNETLHSEKSLLLQVQRILRKLQSEDFNADILISLSEHSDQFSQDFVSIAVPFLITFGLLNICMLYVCHIIEDVSSQRREYMRCCSLHLSAFWMGCFLVDLALWILIVSVFWFIYQIGGLPIFSDHLLISLALLILSGPGFIFLTYCVSFVFDSPETGVDFTFIILIAPLFLFSEDGFTNNIKFNMLLFQMGRIYPVSNLFNLFNILAMKSELSVWEFVPLAIGTTFLIALLCFIEWTLTLTDRAFTAAVFALNEENLAARRAKYLSFGAEEMEMRAADRRSRYAIRIERVSRLFGSLDLPVCAVNNVSLGLAKGETFGLLGGNGAGKTTLMRMILGLVSPSHGRIEISGDIGFCPQFDDHLTAELTPIENLFFYGMLFGLSDPEIDWRVMKLLDELDLVGYKNQVVGELSGGTKRKLAVAIALLSSAPVVILDEPTSSLDADARRRVQELIVREKSTSRTFLLCTHLLKEAEVLCDKIGILMKGCLFTCGTPKQLASYFGRDWKIEILFEGPVENVESLLRERIPDLKLLFVRDKGRIYSVPCMAIPFEKVFRVLEEAKEANLGIEYFTVSALTLENIFVSLLKVT